MANVRWFVCPVMGSNSFSGTITSGNSFLGDSFNGQFSYDTGASTNSSTPTHNNYATGTLSFTVGANDYSFTSTSKMTTDVYYQFNGSFNQFSLSEFDNPIINELEFLQGPLTSTALPNPLTDAPTEEIVVDNFIGGPSFVGTISQFQQPSSVPEPSSLFLAATALVAALGLHANRRRAGLKT